MNNSTDKFGSIDAVATVKSIDELRDLIRGFENFTNAHPKTIRRFDRKAARRLAEFRKGGK